MVKKPTPIRKDAPTVQIFGKIKNVEVAGKGSDAHLIVTIVAKLDQASLRQKLVLDKMWEAQAGSSITEAPVMVQIDATS